MSSADFVEVLKDVPPAIKSTIDTLFVCLCCVFCFPIIFAVGQAYGGYCTRKNALSAFYTALMTMSCCTIQWWILGYSLCFGEGQFFGNFDYVFHKDVGSNLIGTIPAILFSFFELLFQAVVCSIVVGGFVERGRLTAVIPFIFLWSTLIYNPLAHSVWGGGFLQNLGVIDFAGGTPVHVDSGASATAVSVYLSWPLMRSRRLKDRTPQRLALHRAHNNIHQMLGMIAIWTGWLAFDAGTVLAFNYRALYAFFNTLVCAASGSITFATYLYLESGAWSLDAYFLGMISGLVMITPSAAFISMKTAIFFGFFGSVFCRQALRFKFTKLASRLRWVDNGDTFATHLCGGLAATIMTGLFASKDIAFLDGETVIDGGVFFDGNIKQLGIQLLEATVGLCWSFCVSFLIMCLIDSIPGLEVLNTDESVIEGQDYSQMRESFYIEQSQICDENYFPFEGKGPVEI